MIQRVPYALMCVVGAAAFALRAPVWAQVPTFQEVSGHALGERITQHHDMQRYLERLAEVSPRVRVIRQGASWEGRAFLLAVVTAPEHHARLDAIQAASLSLSDPRRTDVGAARALIADQPVVVWFGGSIHGFELSGAEGLLKLLEHLATRDDPATLEVLRQAVVLIDPMLNPDGRDAFAHVNHENIGRVPNPERDDWANDFTGWQALKFRTGHYYFDTNRDWFAHTQRETRDRIPWLHAWRPQVAVDMHEMGPNAEFYFDPPGDPTSPHFPRFALRWFQQFGNAYAAAFDSAGFEYMTRERYNYFYPGYTSNRGYHGAVSMLFEQGSSRGMALTRGDGSVRSLADALEQQYLAAWTATRVAAARRVELLTEYYESQRAAIADGARGYRRYLIPPEGDPALVRELARLLHRNAIEVEVLEREARLSGVRDRAGTSVGQRTFPAGTYVVDAAQPAGRMARALLEPDVPLPADFLAAARARVERDENPRFYDITGWSLPLLFNVGGYSATDAAPLPTRRFTTEQVADGTPSAAAQASYAYLLDGRNAAALSVLYHLEDRGYRTGVLTAPSRIAGREVPGGSVIVRVGQNDPSVHDAVHDLAARYEVNVMAMQTGLSDSGYPSLGSGDHTFNVEKPVIALVAEEPVFAYSFGWTWYTLDRQYEIPTTVLRTRSVAGTDLSRFNVLVVPAVSGSALADELGERGVQRLRQWVRDGGTLVTIAGATDFARKELELIALRDWYDTDDGKNAQRFDVPGALFRTDLDRGFWLSAGYDAGGPPVLVDSDRLYLPPDGPPSARRRVVVRYAAGGGARLAGHAWPESQARLPGKVFLYEERVGAGRVIAFAEDPNFRGYVRGVNRLFLNAVILGPSAP